MQVVHTSYIKKLADQTGKTYRELETLWKKFEREVENERMFNPNKFSHLKSKDGSIAQEVARRFEEFLVNPLGVETEKKMDEVANIEEDILSDEIEKELNDDLDEQIEDIEGEIPEIETSSDEPEIKLDDFEDLEDIGEPEKSSTETEVEEIEKTELETSET